MARVTPKIVGRGSGRPTISYRHVDGSRHDAVVTSASGTTMSLYVPSLPLAQRRKTGIAKGTARTQTNVWF